MGPPSEIADVVAAAPYDPKALAVFADWLQQHGDPRGELVALYLQADRSPDVAARLAELRNAIEPVPERSGVISRNGLAYRVLVTEQTLPHLPGLLRSTAAWGLTEVIASQGGLHGLIPMLAVHADALPNVRSLQLRGDVMDTALHQLLARLPRLSRLRVDGRHAPFRIASELTALSAWIDPEARRPAWADRPHPALEKLWLRSDARLDALPWLVGGRFPRLRKLGLVGRELPAFVPSLGLGRYERVGHGTTDFSGRAAAARWEIEEHRPVDLAADAVLLAIAGEGIEPGTVMPLHRDEVIIGRHMACDYLIESPHISKRQARFRRGAGWTITEMATTYGVRLENICVGDQPCPLRNGHDVQLGHTLFRFLQGNIPALVAAN